MRYIAPCHEESASAALVFGSGIHAVIEGVYREELAVEAKPDVERMRCLRFVPSNAVSVSPLRTEHTFPVSIVGVAPTARGAMRQGKPRSAGRIMMEIQRNVSGSRVS
ncbi:MAG: hypothetical protein EBR86_12120 [Planctomycetia bacterium]|nr:hypothetical protein [Planctomycetia bacterium]